METKRWDWFVRFMWIGPLSVGLILLTVLLAIGCRDEETCAKYESALLNKTSVGDIEIGFYENGCHVSCGGDRSDEDKCEIVDPGYFDHGSCNVESLDKIVARYVSVYVIIGVVTFVATLTVASVVVGYHRRIEANARVQPV